MAPREELLVILDLTSTVLRAGVGVTDLIRGPLLELPTRIGRKLGHSPSRVEDYLVGHYLSQAEQSSTSTRDFEIVYPLVMDPQTGFKVVDWIGLEALLRYCFHTSLQLPRPPLAHPTVLSIPPSLPPSIVDQLHRLLFEKLLVPSLLCSTRPFYACASSGINSGLILDIGWRGEGCEVTVVHENRVLQEASQGNRIHWVDEGVLDDYSAVNIWKENKESLLKGFKGALEKEEVSQSECLDGVRRIVGELKLKDLIGFQSKHFKPNGNTTTTNTDGDDQDGTFDVAKAVVEGKVSEIVKAGSSKKSLGKKNSKTNGGEEEEDFVTIPNPFSPPPPPPPIDLTIPQPEIPLHANLEIGPSRHRYLEPLFFPQVLSKTLTNSNDHAKEIGLTYFENITVPHSGIQELLGNVLMSIQDNNVREAVSENLVVISSGRVASNKALGNTLIPLLSPYVQSPVAIDLYAEGGPLMNKSPMKFAKCPEYFSNFKRHGGDWAVYLGACIMGKLLIGDQQSKLFMSKADYAQKGPAYYRQIDLIP